jgi:hypothetical protein
MIKKTIKALFKRSIYENFKVIYDDFWFDIINGTDTTSLKMNKLYLDAKYNEETVQSAIEYIPTKTTTINQSIDILIRNDQTILNNIFVDFGCGKGRVIMTAFNKGFQSIYGIEYSKELCVVAMANLNKIGAVNCHIVNDDASKFEITKDMVVFYFYNPFDRLIMKKVLANIDKVHSNNPVNRYIVYIKPLCEDLFVERGYQMLFRNDKTHLTNWKI